MISLWSNMAVSSSAYVRVRESPEKARNAMPLAFAILVALPVGTYELTIALAGSKLSPGP